MATVLRQKRLAIFAIIPLVILGFYVIATQDYTPDSAQGRELVKRSPGLVGITYYINTTPDSLQNEMRGKVILYDFWTANCINCIHTIPHLNYLNSKYSTKGLLIIGVHSPETPLEKSTDYVKDAVGNYGIKYPVVLDTNFQTWNAFGNRYWPSQYLVDSDGFIRYQHIGEGDYDAIENEIQKLLSEKSTVISGDFTN